MHKFCFIFMLLSLPGLASFGQRGNSSLPFFVKYGGMKHGRKFEVDKPIDARIIYKADTINTLVRVESEKILPAEKAAFKKISLEDTALHRVVFVKGYDSLKLVRILFSKNKLMRLLFDTLGFKIYDDALSFSKSVEDVDYDEIVFEYNNNFYEVFDFWATSRKRSMIDVLNKIFAAHLQYKEYKGKEKLLESILRFQNPEITAALLKNYRQ